MGTIAKLFLFLCAVIYTIAVVRLLIKRRISEKNTINWLSAVFIVFLLASIPEILDKIAYSIGINYPPSLLFLSTSLVLLYIALRQAVQLSDLDAKVRELAQLTAVQNQQKFKEKEYHEQVK